MAITSLWPSGLSTRRKKPPTANALPDELVLGIFQIIVNSIDTSLVYKDLLHLQLVCKQWNRIANMIIYSRVEVAGTDNVAALERTLSGDGPDRHAYIIDTLMVGIAELWPGIANNDQFRRRVNCTQLQGINKLVILLAEYELGPPGAHSPSRHSHLSSLLDATIILASSVEPLMTAAFHVHTLPSQLRFLQLPGGLAVPPQISSQPPDFQLFGLTVPDYPSPAAKWVLSSSSSSLQCLTVRTMSDEASLAATHPRLRSLRILSINAGSTQGFQSLRKLERLELRARDAPRSIMTSLPGSLRYFRFWSSDLAEALEESLLTPQWRNRHPNLQVVVWDYWAGHDGVEDVLLRGLQGVCAREGVELRAYQRVDHGERAIKCHDNEYEAYLRSSCFTSENGQNATSPLSATLRQPSTRLPARVLANLMSKGVFLSSNFTHPRYGTGAILLEDCFPDLLTWVADLLPRAEAERLRAREAARQIYGSRKKRRLDWLASKWGEYFTYSSTLVFIPTTVIFFTVLRHHVAARFALASGAAILIIALRASSIVITRYGGWISDRMLFDAGALCACYTFTLSFFIFLSSSTQAKAEGNDVVFGLSIACGILLFFGAGLTCCISASRL